MEGSREDLRGALRANAVIADSYVHEWHSAPVGFDLLQDANIRFRLNEDCYHADNRRDHVEA